MHRNAHTAGMVAATLLAILFVPGRALAGPWAPAPGEGYVKTWLKWLPGFGYHPGDGGTVDYGTYHELFLATYGEVGIAPRVAVLWHTDVVRFFSLEDPRTGDTETHLGPGDPSVGVRWQWLSQERWAAALEATVRAPLADGDPVQTVYAAEGGNPAVGALRVGAGVWDVSGTLHGGYGGDGWYAATSAGWLARTGGYDHAVLWTAEGGGQFTDVLSGRIRFTGVHPVDTGDAPRSESPSGIGNGTAYTGFALEGEWQFAPPWMLGLTLEGGVLGVRRQTGGPVVSVFVATRF